MAFSAFSSIFAPGLQSLRVFLHVQLLDEAQDIGLDGVGVA
jgi:hypothetical protein